MSLVYLFTVILLVVAFKNIKAFNFKVKLLGYYTLVSLVVSLTIPYFLLRPRNVKNLNDVCCILQHIKKLYGVKIILRDIEIMMTEKSAVVVANHQSSLDTFAMFDIWMLSRKMSILAKRELIYLGGTFGIGAWLAGMRFIDRSSGQKAGEAMNREMVDMKKNNEKLFVFPEGTRRNTEEIHEFKKGAFHAAIHAQVPIIPVVFGPYKHIFNSEYKLFTGGEIHIQVLPEISTEGMTNEDVDELMKKTRKVMIDAYEKQKNVVHNKKN